jgi:hypothetical protein
MLNFDNYNRVMCTFDTIEYRLFERNWSTYPSRLWEWRKKSPKSVISRVYCHNVWYFVPFLHRLYKNDQFQNGPSQGWCIENASKVAQIVGKVILIIMVLTNTRYYLCIVCYNRYKIHIYIVIITYIIDLSKYVSWDVPGKLVIGLDTFKPS